VSPSKAEPLSLPRPAAPPAQPAAGRVARPRRRIGTGSGVSFVAVYVSLIVLIPLAAVVVKSQANGMAGFWAQVTTPEAASALKLTVVASIIVALLNVVFGTLIAWVLVRDDFPGKRLLDTCIDLPFALPTIVAGLVLLSLYGNESPVGINMAYTRIGVGVALLFVTLPFVVRTVQPVLIELDVEMEQAAHSLGAGRWTTFRRIILPNLLPAIMAGTGLAFARAISEFGSTVLISGNIPFETQVSAVHIFSQIETDNPTGAAAEATVLLVLALIVIVSLDLIQRWGLHRG
jgi:sulfate/thiosulfate transport system permease protein